MAQWGGSGIPQGPDTPLPIALTYRDHWPICPFWLINPLGVIGFQLPKSPYEFLGIMGFWGFGGEGESGKSGKLVT